ncbi:MAG: hypothetical protein CMI32_00920 [Opitutales bacterium]|nr:hypothetical protein [Opitutales bacterium]
MINEVGWTHYPFGNHTDIAKGPTNLLGISLRKPKGGTVGRIHRHLWQMGSEGAAEMVQAIPT